MIFTLLLVALIGGIIVVTPLARRLAALLELRLQEKMQAGKLKKACKKTPLVLSAQSGDGVREALRALLKIIDKARDATDRSKAKEAV